MAYPQVPAMGPPTTQESGWLSMHAAALFDLCGTERCTLLVKEYF